MEKRFPHLPFLFEWLEGIHQLHELHALEGNFQRYHKYFELKKLVNLKPIPLPVGANDEFVYRFVHDFLAGIRQYFWATFTRAFKAIDRKHRNELTAQLI